jgi:hypothetical protein
MTVLEMKILIYWSESNSRYYISKFNIDREAITNPDWEPTLYMGTGGKVPTKQSTSSKL